MPDARELAAAFAESGDEPAGRALLLALADLYRCGIVEPCAACGAAPFGAEGVSTYVNCGGCGVASHARRPVVA